VPSAASFGRTIPIERHAGYRPVVTVVLRGSDLSIEDLVRVARDAETVRLDDAVISRMRATRAVVERSLERGDAVYGLTTGVGVQKEARRVPDAASERALIGEHRVASGTAAPPDVVLATMLVLANQLALGFAGVRPELVQRLVDVLHEGAVPEIRTQGSIGQADLAPMADLAVALMEEIEPAPGEGLALLSTNAFATGWSALAVHDAGRLLDAAELAGAGALDALGANLGMLHPVVVESRPVPGLASTLERLRGWMAGSRLEDPARARALQDPLSFRSLPQVLGAVRDAVDRAGERIEAELNASQGNPVVVAAEDRIVSVANFDALPIALAVDEARAALASALTSSAERTAKLLDTAWSGLSTGLGPGGAAGGLSFLGIAVQSLVTEARLLAHPVSFELATTTIAEGIEDRSVPAALGARRLSEMNDLGRRIVAAELAVGTRATELRGERPIGAAAATAHAFVARHAPAALQGRPSDLQPLADALFDIDRPTGTTRS
jgi:histidine ammonia-lyase